MIELSFFYLVSCLNTFFIAVFQLFLPQMYQTILVKPGGLFMPRNSRKKSCTQTYHVVVKGADRQLLFEESRDYKKYLEIIEYYKQQCQSITQKK